MEIKVDPELRDLVPPLTREERQRLEESIIQEGCRDALVVWQGQNIIIDGHNRHEICIDNGIKFRTILKAFQDRAEVRQWIITNQLGRRNLTPEKFAYMLGKLYEERKKEEGRPEKLRQNDAVNSESSLSFSKRTSEIISDEYKVAPRTVERAAVFAQAVDKISESLGERAKEEILNREVDLTRKEIIEIAELKPQQQKEIYEELKKEDNETTREQMALISSKIKKNNMAVHFSSDRMDWGTPQDFFDLLNKEFNFTLDVCATNETAKCIHYFTSEIDGLLQSWKGVCWMNPPYGNEITNWMKKAYEESRRGAVVVCLVPSRTDTNWWHFYAMKAIEIRFIWGRLRFGGSETSAPFPSAIVILKFGYEGPPLVSGVKTNG